MFIGHFAVGMGAKAARPAISLGTLFLAAQLLDLLWPTFLLLGWEEVAIEPGNTVVTPLNFTHYPISHSLLLVAGWSLLAGGLYWLFSKSRGGALVVGLCVLSHWVLDVFMHRPDLPLFPGKSPLFGLGLWNSLLASVLVEGALFAIGVMLYVRSTRALDKIGQIGFWVLIAFLLFVQTGNYFGPPPARVADIAWVGQMQWILVLWGYWVDRHRGPVTSSPQYT
jgi:membrane-bound metal-dependent hydrolase YbcI (DUF457 family)